MKENFLIVLANSKLKNEVGELLSLRLGKNFVNLEGVLNIKSHQLLKYKPGMYYKNLKEQTIISLKELNNSVISVNKHIFSEEFIKKIKSLDKNLTIIFAEISEKDFIKNYESDAADLDMELLTYNETNLFFKRFCQVYVKTKKFDKEFIVMDIIKQLKKAQKMPIIYN